MRAEYLNQSILVKTINIHIECYQKFIMEAKLNV